MVCDRFYLNLILLNFRTFVLLTPTISQTNIETLTNRTKIRDHSNVISRLKISYSLGKSDGFRFWDLCLHYLYFVSQETMALVLNHLKKISSHCEKNKMNVDNLAVCFGPVLLCPSPKSTDDHALDFKRHIEVLRYLLQIWPENYGLFLSLKFLYCIILV